VNVSPGYGNEFASKYTLLVLVGIACPPGVPPEDVDQEYWLDQRPVEEYVTAMVQVALDPGLFVIVTVVAAPAGHDLGLLDIVAVPEVTVADVPAQQVTVKVWLVADVVTVIVPVPGAAAV